MLQQAARFPALAELDPQAHHLVVEAVEVVDLVLPHPPVAPVGPSVALVAPHRPLVDQEIQTARMEQLQVKARVDY